MELEIGPYRLSGDIRGLRMVREVAADHPAASALLQFVVEEQGVAPLLLTSLSLTAIDEETAELHGMTEHDIALDGRITYDRESEGLEVRLEIFNTTQDMAVRVGVRLSLAEEAEPQWLIPGLFYNENRAGDSQRLYPGFTEIQRDPERFLSNHWSFRSDRAALPVVICQTYSTAAFLAVEEVVGITDMRPHGIGPTSIGFSTNDGFPELKVHAPAIEEPVKYSFCHESRTAPEELFFPLERGESFAITVTAGLRPAAPGVREVIYRALYSQRWVLHTQRPKLSTIEADRLAMQGLVRWHYDDDSAMINETAAFDRHFGRFGGYAERAHMHVGWLSGVFPAYVMLWHGRDTTNPEEVRRATRVIDTITAEMAPCGSLWPLFTREGTAAGFGPEQGLAHSRTIAEAVLFLIRALRLELQASTPHPSWYNAMVSNLNFILGTQREDGAFPAYWRVDDGEATDYNGMAGMCWIGPLVACNNLTSTSIFHEAAVRAGEYYSRFIEDGLLYGTVEDLPGVPTCDDAHWAVISYLLLYECDRSSRWLDLACRAADIALTFRVAYNITFPPGSMLAQSGFATRGGDVSSVATPTLTANGLVSYGEFLRLSKLTGDPYFEERAREGRTFATQLIARIDGEFNARQGMAVGQIFHTDWWQPKGVVLSLSHAWTLALIEHAELIERYWNIQEQALEGDHESVVLAATQSSLVQLQRDMVLPEKAETHRRKELIRQRSREIATPAASFEGGMEPVESLSRSSIEATAPRSSGGTAMGGAPLPINQPSGTRRLVPPRSPMTPLPAVPGSGAPPRPPRVTPAPEGLPAGLSGSGRSGSDSKSAVPKFDQPARFAESRAASKTPFNPPAKRKEPTRPATDFPFRPSGEYKLPANLNLPRPKTPEPVTTTSSGTVRTPFELRHTPLTPSPHHPPTEESMPPLLAPKREKSERPPILKPPKVEGGLLSNLQSEDERPRFTSLSELSGLHSVESFRMRSLDPATGKMRDPDLEPPPTPPAEEEHPSDIHDRDTARPIPEETGPDMTPPPDDDSGEDKGPVRWKIF